MTTFIINWTSDWTSNQAHMMGVGRVPAFMNNCVRELFVNLSEINENYSQLSTVSKYWSLRPNPSSIVRCLILQNHCPRSLVLGCLGTEDCSLQLFLIRQSKDFLHGTDLARATTILCFPLRSSERRNTKFQSN